MDFTLPESALAVQRGIADICARYDLDYWQRCENEKRWPEEVWAELAKGAGSAWPCPRSTAGRAGPAGAGRGHRDPVRVRLGRRLGVHLRAHPRFRRPDPGQARQPRQRGELLPKLATGELETCFALTEPDAGSNALGISTFARRDGEEFVVKGQKIWITGVQRATWMLLVTRTIPAAEAKPQQRPDGPAGERPRGGRRRAATFQPIPKMGANTTPSNMVFIDDLRVPAANVVGEVDQGSRVLWDILNPERILRPPRAGRQPRSPCKSPPVRPGARGLRPADRRQPGDRVPARPDQGQDRAGQADDLQGRVAVRPEPPCGSEANVAKLTAAQAAWEAADQGVPDLRRHGLPLEYPVARLLADARIGRVAPVTEELLLNHLATQVLGLPRSF